MRTYHVTPAIDIWSMGIVMFSFFSEKKPFYEDCKANNLIAIASLVGAEKVIDVHRKYRYPIQK